MTRLAVDMSILRHPPSGTARYATELLRCMPEALGAGYDIVVERGYPRARWRNPLRRSVNVAGDLLWLTAGAITGAALDRIDVWYSPSNILPIGIPRPAVVTIHDVNFLDPESGYDRGYVRFAAAQFARSARSAQAIVTHSQHARSAIAQELDVDPARIIVAYPGIDHLPVRTGAQCGPPAAPYALWVGRTEPHKNVPLLVAAWTAVSGGLRLVIAGPEGRDEPRIAERIAASPARDRIDRLGAVDDERLACLYAQATCFLFPSRAEGFGLPPLEAMRLGIPTAVADASCLPEVTRGAAHLFDPDDPHSVVRAVEAILSPAATERARIAGPEAAGHYRWTETAATVAGAIHAAAGTRRLA